MHAAVNLALVVRAVIAIVAIPGRHAAILNFDKRAHVTFAF
jgi:hypothetical protein